MAKNNTGGGRYKGLSLSQVNLVGTKNQRQRQAGENYDLGQVSHRHEAILNWLLLNPDKTLRECADQLGYTQAWVSALVHSELFQLALKQRQERVTSLVIASIPEKLRQAADVGLGKLVTALEESEDPEFILDATDKVLHRMGFAPASARNPGGSPAVGNQQNNFYISAGDLEQARGLMQGAAEAQALVQPARLSTEHGLVERCDLSPDA